MKPLKLARYLAGYAAGFALFAVFVPYVICSVSTIFAEPAIVDHPIVLVAAALLGSLGAFFVLWSNAVLILKGNGGAADIFNVVVSPRTENLVITGPYRYTRNPMVFGAFCCYFGLAFLLNSLPALLFLVVFYVFAVNYLKAVEEKRLLRDFGPEYEEYRGRVAMMVPRICMRQGRKTE